MRSLLVVLPLLGTAACGTAGGGVTCTTEARASVMVSVVDLDGAAITDAVVTYSSDGSAQDQDCFDGGSGSFSCGFEESGPITVTASAEGFFDATQTVVVEADECHVITAALTLELEPLACTDEIAASVVVTVTDTSNQDVNGGDVVWNMADEDDLPEPCLQTVGNEWICGEEVAGDIRIDIDNAGPYQPFSTVVTVGEDECHVITEQLDAVLEFLPD